MDIGSALSALRAGASLRQIAADCQNEWLAAAGMKSDQPPPAACHEQVAAFLRSFARHLGDRCAGEPRIGMALREWVEHTDHYEAWDALLSSFAVDGRLALVRRGRLMFPGPLTAHWNDA